MQYPDAVPARSRAHPRGRGEHFLVRDAYAQLMGSSPRARGTYHGDDLWHLGERLIPAGAGNILLHLGEYP